MCSRLAHLAVGVTLSLTFDSSDRSQAAAKASEIVRAFLLSGWGMVIQSARSFGGKARGWSGQNSSQVDGQLYRRQTCVCASRCECRLHRFMSCIAHVVPHITATKGV